MSLNIDNLLLDRLDPECNYFQDLDLLCDTQSNYHSIGDFNLKLSENKPKFSVVNHNIRSFNANLDHFLNSFSPESFPDCFIFTETWCTETDSPYIAGYEAFHSRRTSGRSGGVSIFISTKFNSRILPDITVNINSIETCSVEVATATESIVLCGVYRPHGDTVENFRSSLDRIMNDSSIGGKTAIFAGDFNINGLSEDLDNLAFTDLMRSHHFFPVITKPTRIPTIDSQSPTLLDQISSDVYFPTFFSGQLASKRD